MVFAVVSVMLGTIGMAQLVPNPPSAIVEKQPAEMEKAVAFSFNPLVCRTVGNHSFVYINKDGNPWDNPTRILILLDVFEKAHPELEMTNWHIEKQQGAYITPAWVSGVWIDHKPKPKTAK